jgi:RimJ/RimL family protein N-acetyltransferase
MVPPAYAFRPMSEQDLPRVRRWLSAPHVAQWWGDPFPANGRAIRAYEKAGFQKIRVVDTPDGHAVLMVRDA